MTFPLTNHDDALADFIVNTWVSRIREFDATQTDLEGIQQEIAWARELMCASNWPAIYQHDFLVRLRTTLTELTDAHPVTRQFVQMLEIETEFN
jgi:hypothetical protein